MELLGLRTVLGGRKRRVTVLRGLGGDLARVLWLDFCRSSGRSQSDLTTVDSSEPIKSFHTIGLARNRYETKGHWTNQSDKELTEEAKPIVRSVISTAGSRRVRYGLQGTTLDRAGQRERCCVLNIGRLSCGSSRRRYTCKSAQTTDVSPHYIGFAASPIFQRQ